MNSTWVTVAPKKHFIDDITPGRNSDATDMFTELLTTAEGREGADPPPEFLDQEEEDLEDHGSSSASSDGEEEEDDEMVVPVPLDISIYRAFLEALRAVSVGGDITDHLPESFRQREDWQQIENAFRSARPHEQVLPYIARPIMGLQFFHAWQQAEANRMAVVFEQGSAQHGLQTPLSPGPSLAQTPVLMLVVALEVARDATGAASMGVLPPSQMDSTDNASTVAPLNDPDAAQRPQSPQHEQQTSPPSAPNVSSPNVTQVLDSDMTVEQLEWVLKLVEEVSDIIRQGRR